MKSIGERLTLVRLVFGLNQHELADIAETGFPIICRWEKQPDTIPAESRKIIAKNLNLLSGWLASGSGFPFRSNGISYMRPRVEHYEIGRDFIAAAIKKADEVNVVWRSLGDHEAYFVLVFQLDDKVSSIIYLSPHGFDEAFQGFLAGQKKVIMREVKDLPQPNVYGRIPLGFEETLVLAFGRNSLGEGYSFSDLSSKDLFKTETVRGPDIVEIVSARIVDNDVLLTLKCTTCGIPFEYKIFNDELRKRCSKKTYLHGVKRRKSVLASIMNNKE